MIEHQNKERLGRIAQSQRMMIYAVLVNIGAIAIMVGAGVAGASELGSWLAMPLLLVGGLMSLYGTATLSFRLWNVAAAITACVMMCIPVVNLLALLVLFNRASARLQEAGVEVAFLGAQAKQFD